jgi:hypothetical protein
MAKNKRRRFLVPENLNVELLLAECNPEPFISKRRRFRQENLLIVIDTLYRLMSNPKKNKYAVNNFTPIKLKYLRKYVPNAEDYLKYLVHSNILLKDNYYIPDIKSYGYKFDVKYIGTPTVYVLGKNIDSIQSYELAGFTKQSKKLKHLYIWLNEKLTIDIAGAMKEAFANYWQRDGEKLPICYDDIDFSVTTKTGINRRSEKYVNEEHESQYLSLLGGVIIPLSTYEQKEFYFQVDESGYRVHTNLTNLKKGLRKYVKYGGKSLVSYDIKNSQPFFLNVVLDKDFWTKSKTGDKITIGKIQNPSGTLRAFHRRATKHPLTVRTFDETQYSKGFQLFKKVTLDGSLYEFICEKHLELTGQVLEREKAKRQLITLLYDTSRKNRSYVYDIEDTVDAVFPGLMDFCNSLKTKKEYNKLALLLQNIESTVVLRMVCKNIAQKYPEMPLFTVHDSIATTEDFATILGPLIASEIESVVGFKPTIKEEKWY